MISDPKGGVQYTSSRRFREWRLVHFAMIAAAVPDVKLVAPEDDAARMKKVVTVEEVLLVVTCDLTHFRMVTSATQTSS